MFSCFLRTTRTRNKDKAPVCSEDDRCVDPPQFTLRSLTAATGNFAAKNRLGMREGQQKRGGILGPVFKGKLKDGQVVAVRSICTDYWQTFQFHELTDKLLLARKLKHDNIVHLLGVCLEQPEKLLVYEYLPNASLDTILYDAERRRRHLDWQKRYSIIRGIARGLLYLHEESGVGTNLKVILRPSKVLLDKDMNPKIFDAGIPPPNVEVRPMFWGHSVFPYAAPEFVATGTTCTKSDMFSFGVILLEMVTGRRMNYASCNATTKDLSQNGLTYVWDKWKSGSIADIADPSMGHRYPQNEMRNCVHIGLLCLHVEPKHRPNASTVMQALDASCPMSLLTPSMPNGTN